MNQYIFPKALHRYSNLCGCTVDRKAVCCILLIIRKTWLIICFIFLQYHLCLGFSGFSSGNRWATGFYWGKEVHKFSRQVDSVEIYWILLIWDACSNIGAFKKKKWNRDSIRRNLTYCRTIVNYAYKFIDLFLIVLSVIAYFLFVIFSYALWCSNPFDIWGDHKYCFYFIHGLFFFCGAGNNRPRFQPGRGSGFRNEGVRGRGNYGGGRGGYNRGGDFGGRGEFGNRGGNRGGSSNRDGYQKSDNMSNNGGRMNRAGGIANGSAKNMTPRVSATAWGIIVSLEWSLS